MIQIIFENKFFLVLFKPAGISVHNQTPSLLDYIRELKKPDHFVNRLDVETSGLVIIAQSEQLHEPLRQSLDSGIKKYRALLRGSLSSNSSEASPSAVSATSHRPPNSILWSWPISDKAEGRRNPQGEAAHRKAALTEVLLKRQNKYFSEVEIILKTGRQHQIRKHSALAKHAIVGDDRYNDQAYNKKISSLYNDSRMQLEAESVSFEFQKEKYFFEHRSLNLDPFFT